MTWVQRAGLQVLRQQRPLSVFPPGCSFVQVQGTVQPLALGGQSRPLTRVSTMLALLFRKRLPRCGTRDDVLLLDHLTHTADGAEGSTQGSTFLNTEEGGEQTPGYPSRHLLSPRPCLQQWGLGEEDGCRPGKRKGVVIEKAQAIVESHLCHEPALTLGMSLPVSEPPGSSFIL